MSQLLLGSPDIVGGSFLCAGDKYNRGSLFSLCPESIGSSELLENNLLEDEIFLYDCPANQIRDYYKSKNLSIKLREGLVDIVGEDIKKLKI